MAFTLSSPTAVSTGQTTALGTVVTNGSNGMIYMVVTQTGPPTSAQIRNGLDNTGAPALFAGSTLVGFPGTRTLPAISGLSPATQYLIYYVHFDNFLIPSNVAASPVFTTDSVAIPAQSRGRTRSVVVRGDIL